MTNEEAKQALLSGAPVVYQDIEYKCISAVIYRHRIFGKKDVIVPSVELTDKSAARAVVIAPIHRVMFPP